MTVRALRENARIKLSQETRHWWLVPLQASCWSYGRGDFSWQFNVRLLTQGETITLDETF